MPERTDDPPPRARRIPPALVSALIALLLTVLAFPEVVFLGGSLASAGLNTVVDGSFPEETVSVYPDPEYGEPREGLYDLGARAWQFEPAAKFMSRTIDDGDSPAWNPYSAAGSLGPETLVDMKLSPFVLAVALLGASSTAFTVVLLAFIAFALYCLLQFFSRTLGLSRVAGVGAAVMFLLNGWSAGMLTSAMSGPYVLFPVVLYALTEYRRERGPARFLACVAAYTALLATTFAPAIVLVLILVHSVAFLLEVSRSHEATERGQGITSLAGIAVGQLIFPVLALLVTAYIWLPNVAALLHGGEEMGAYGQLDLVTKRPVEALGVLTPRHVYAWFVTDTTPADVPLGRWTAFIGLVPLVLILAALPRARDIGRRLLVLLSALASVGVVMHLGIPGLRLIGHLPGLTPISASYWSSLTCAAATLAVGVAIETAIRHGLSARVAAGAGALFALALVLGIVDQGWPTRDLVGAGLVVSFLIIAMAVGLIWFASRRPVEGIALGVLVLALMAAELLSYNNHTRPMRDDHEDRLPAYLTFVQDNVGNQRVYNAGRGALYPEWGAALGIRQIETIQIMQLPWYREFYFDHINTVRKGAQFLTNEGTTDSRFTAQPRALDLLSVRYLIVDQEHRQLDQEIAARYPLAFVDDVSGVDVYENPTAFPRTYVSPALTEGTGKTLGPLWSQAVTFTEDEELLEAAEAAGVPRTPAFPGGSASIVDEDNDRVTIRVTASASGVVVLTDSFHDNWQVTVNGDRGDVGLVNETVRGVVVPAGTSTVVFAYRSAPRDIGAVISVATVVLLLVVAAVWALRSRRRRPGRTPRTTRSSSSKAWRPARRRI